jgi:hypothetical protein
MNDEELRLMAGIALGLNEGDMRFFNPLLSDSQTLAVANMLKLNIHINVFANKTEISKIDETGRLLILSVEPHDIHGGDLGLAMRYAVLRAVPGLGLIIPVHMNKQSIASSDKKQCLKHGLRVCKSRVNETVAL